jgi:hypothetical protein
MIGSLGCGQNKDPQDRDESHAAPTPGASRSKSCSDLSIAADLKRLLQAAPSQNGDAGGLNHGKAMWALSWTATGSSAR